MFVFHNFSSFLYSTHFCTENGSVKYVEIGTQTCTVTDFIFTGPTKVKMGSLPSPASLHNIPYADQSSLPPLTISMGTVIEASTNTGIGVVTDSATVTTTNQMVSSTSFNNISGNSNSLTSCSAVNFNGKQLSEENHNKIASKTANNRNETCVRQRNGNFIS